MKNITVAWLSQGKKLDQHINYQLQALKMRRESICGPGSSWTMGNRVQTSIPEEARFARALERVADMEEDINRQIDQLADLRKQIEQAIDQVSPDYCQLTLRYRYLLGKSWPDIAEDMNASKTTVKHWHQLGIQQVKLPDNAIWIGKEEML